MVNISRFALGASLICSLLWAVTPSMALTNEPGKVLTNFPKGGTAPALMTNHTYFTGHTFLVPAKSANWPEVKDAYREDIFKDVHEVDNESPLRRFEVVFLISLPATLLLNTALLTALQFVETQVVGGGFETTRNYYLYAGSALMSVGIACQDYRNIKKRRDAEGLNWEILRKKF
jgi:hypothetical protein